MKLFVAGKDGRVDPDLNGVFIVGWLFILWVLMTTLVNRLHDINHRGLWALIIIVPVVIFPPAIVIAPVFCVILGCIPHRTHRLSLLNRLITTTQAISGSAATIRSPLRMAALRKKPGASRALMMMNKAL